MGTCMSSKTSNAEPARTTTENADKLLVRQAQTQRRRLSIQPSLVGDIDGKRINPSDGTSSARRISLGASVDDSVVPLVHAEDEDAQRENGVFALSKKGFVPYNRKKMNQDAFILKQGFNGDEGISLYAVCDGHGEFGHVVSAFVKKQLPLNLEEKSLKLREDPQKSITDAVAELCATLENSSINVAFSGTTLVFGLRVDDELFVANIGDSRCVLAQQQQSEEKLEAKPLSIDHKPDNPEEKERILKAGGRVEPLPGPPNEDLGPFRVWLADVDVPGLAMSRSIGDEVSHTVGVVSLPEITRYSILESDRFLLWASDGVWEFISNQEAVDIVGKHFPDLERAARDIVHSSVQKWREVEEVVDDITIVILSLEKA